MIEKQLLPTQFGWRSFNLWIVLTLAGYFLSIGFHFPTSFAVNTFNSQAIDLGSGVVGFVFGAVSGLIIASLQWIVLRSWAPKARLWILLNAIGFGLIHGLGDAMPYMPVVLVGGGFIIGLAQYVALRHVLTRPMLWIPIAAIAWFAGFQLGLTLPHEEGEYNLTLAALTYGAITGLALRLMLVEKRVVPTEPDASSLLRSWSDLKPVNKLLVLFVLLVSFAILVVFSGMMFGLG